jgi:uncharacterized membrane protein
MTELLGTTDLIKTAAEIIAVSVEGIGIAIIGLVCVFVVSLFAAQMLRGQGVRATYGQMRQVLGRGILLGLEFLVAADIIHTVAVELTFKTVGVLAVIVLIRTFLSVALELELTGRWPWQKGEEATP